MQYHAPQPDVQDTCEASPAWNDFSMEDWNRLVPFSTPKLPNHGTTASKLILTPTKSRGSICLPNSACSVDSAVRYWSGQTSAKPCRKRDLLQKAVGPASNFVFPTAGPQAQQRYVILSGEKNQQENYPASSKALVVKRPLPLASWQGRISSPSGQLRCHKPMAPSRRVRMTGVCCACLSWFNRKREDSKVRSVCLTFAHKAYDRLLMSCFAIFGTISKTL